MTDRDAFIAETARRLAAHRGADPLDTEAAAEAYDLGARDAHAAAGGILVEEDSYAFCTSTREVEKLRYELEGGEDDEDADAQA